MGEQALRSWRIPAAILVSAAIIAGAYLLAKSVESPPSAEASAETALLQAIAAKDSDNDGLPDWEETLYGTDPHNPDSFNLGMTDGEAVAKGLIVPKAVADAPISSGAATSTIDGLTVPAEGSLTDAFAKSFFSLYVSAKEANGGAELSADQTSTLADQALAALSSSVTTPPDFKSAGDLSVRGSGAEALRSFAADADAVFAKNTSTATTTEMMYAVFAIAGNDPTARTQLASIAKTYRDAAVGLSALSVPEELAPADLELINAMVRLSRVIGDLARVESDPLTAMVTIRQYLPTATAFTNALADIGSVYAAEGVSFSAGEPGAVFAGLAAGARDRANASL